MLLYDLTKLVLVFLKKCLKKDDTYQILSGIKSPSAVWSEVLEKGKVLYVPSAGTRTHHLLEFQSILAAPLSPSSRSSPRRVKTTQKDGDTLFHAGIARDNNEKIGQLAVDSGDLHNQPAPLSYTEEREALYILLSIASPSQQ